MRVTDEEYTFNETNKERKRNSYGARCKKNGAKSKKCTLPSDNLTKKEREALNGKIMTYKIKGISWKEFISYPIDIQKNILDTYATKNARPKDVSEYLGVNHNTFKNHLHKAHLGPNNLRNGNSGRHPDWDRYIADSNKTIDTPEEIPAEVEPDIASEHINIINESKPDHGTFKWEDTTVHPTNAAMTFEGFPIDVYDSVMKLMNPLKKYKITIVFEEQK